MVEAKDVRYDLKVTKVDDNGNNLVAKSSWSNFCSLFQIEKKNFKMNFFHDSNFQKIPFPLPQA